MDGQRQQIEYRLLGPLEVYADGRLLPLRSAKQRALLALLLLSANDIVSSERLIAELWGAEPPRTAANTLQVYVSQMRKLLEPERDPKASGEVLVTRPPGYLLRVEPGQLDLHRFERLVEEGRAALAAGDPVTAAARLRAGLSLWRGEPLADFVFESFAQAPIGRLGELRLEALEERIEADLALGASAELVGELEQLARANPLWERLWAQLMLALYRSGRQADALEAYRSARRALVDELGIEPGPTLQRLQQAILRQDPSLERPPREPAPGAPPAAGQAPHEARKAVTVALTTVSVSSLAAGPLDPEALRDISARALDEVSGALERHGATVERLPGNTLTAYFGVPAVHEDDALRAARASVEARAAIGRLSAELEGARGAQLALRAGLSTGEVIVAASSGGASLVAGDSVDAAAQLKDLAAPGEILIGEATYRAVRSAVRAKPQGRRARAWRLLEVHADSPAIARRLDAPMVGREHELVQLRQTFDRTVRERTCHLVTVLGPAGIGKSRLARELKQSLEGEAELLSGRCHAYGEGITFRPLAEVVKQAAGDDVQAGVGAVMAGEPDADLVATRIAAALGSATSPASTEEIRWAARRLVECLARRRPLVTFFDDVQWAEPGFLDLVEHLADWVRDAPALIVCLARPELLDARPTWGGGRVNTLSLLLEPLSEDESEILIANLVGGEGLAEELLRRITAAAEGNPLFIEEMVAMVSEGGDGTGPIPVPPTIQALLAARLDLLPPEERGVLERASVAGKDFGRGALADLVPEASRPQLPRLLEALVRKQLISPGPPGGSGEEPFRFRHQLIRDAAYQAMPKRIRAEMHERFAAWLEQTAGERLPEVEEVVGYHLEQAHGYRLALDPADGRADELAAWAAERLRAAGRRALVRGEVRSAASLLGRASALARDEATSRARVLVDLGAALRECGDFARAELVLAEAGELAGRLGERALRAHARALRLRVRLQVEALEGLDVIRREAEEAVAELEELGDDRALADASYIIAWIAFMRCQAAAAEEALVRSIASAGRAGAGLATRHGIYLYLGTGLFGPLPAPEAIRRCEQVLAESPEQRIAAAAYRALGALRGMRGDFEEGRRCLRRDAAIIEELGLRVAGASAAEEWAILELLSGDPAAAERRLRAGYEVLEPMGEKAGLSTLVAWLAEAVYRQGRYDEALRLTEVSEQAAGLEDIGAHVQWRGPRAKVLARAGRAQEAEALAREAVSLAERTDFLNLHANALVDLAEVLGLGSRGADAVPVIEEALALYRRKGNRVAAQRARSCLEELSRRPARRGLQAMPT